jgi:hypothetical protein
MEEMADAIRAGVEAEDETIQVEPRYVLEPTPLTVDIYPGDPAQDLDAAGMGELVGAYTITVRARINTPDFAASYDKLVALMDHGSAVYLPLFLEDDPTLNGYAADLDCRAPSGLRAYEHPSGQGAYLGFEFTAFVLPALS